MRALLVSFLVACGGGQPAAVQPAAPQPQHAHHAHHPHAHHQGHHRFENADDWVKIFDDPARDAWQKPDHVVELLALAPGMTVADVGAGTGYFEKRLSTAVGGSGAVIALDIEPDMVRYLKERAQREQTPNVEARLATADDPKLEPGSVDRVLVVDTWHHVGQRVAYLEKLAQALRPGGFVLIVDFTMESEKGPPRAHRLAPKTVIEEAEQAGLRATLVDEQLPDQYAVKIAPAS